MLRLVAPVRTDVSEEHLILQEPHGVTSQKTTLFISELIYIWNADCLQISFIFLPSKNHNLASKQHVVILGALKIIISSKLYLKMRLLFKI
jgi:hypothetical protein